jgi:hypothetical protein
MILWSVTTGFTGGYSHSTPIGVGTSYDRIKTGEPVCPKPEGVECE